MSPIKQPESIQDETSPAKETRASRFFKAAERILKIIQYGAKLIKTLLQYIVGLTIVIAIICQVWLLVQTADLSSISWEREASALLQTVAIGLIVSTAIELAYMLFTDGPDEAIDPVITALAAILLLRMPSPTEIKFDITYMRIIEILVYGLIIGILFGIRELYLNGKAKRKSLDKNDNFND